MASQHTHAFAWPPRAEHEPIQIIPHDRRNPMRGLLIGLAISAVLWAALASGIWTGLAFVGIAS